MGRAIHRIVPQRQLRPADGTSINYRLPNTTDKLYASSRFPVSVNYSLPSTSRMPGALQSLAATQAGRWGYCRYLSWGWQVRGKGAQALTGCARRGQAGGLSPLGARISASRRADPSSETTSICRFVLGFAPLGRSRDRRDRTFLGMTCLGGACTIGDRPVAVPGFLPKHYLQP